MGIQTAMAMAWSWSVALPLLSSVLSALLAIGPAAAATPNVLLIVIDDLRPELSAYGYNQSSPNLAKLAQTSALFRGAYCQYSVCSPSRASFLTGLRPDTTRVYDLQTYFRNTPGLQDTVTLPQFFKNRGYRVAGGGKIFHQGVASGGDNDGISWTEPYYTSPNERRFASKAVSWEARSNPEADFPDAQIASNTITQLRDLSNGSFFIAMGLHKPHLPFVFPQAYLDLYPVDVPLANNTSPPTDMPALAWSSYPELRAYQDIASLNILRRPGDWMPVDKARELRRAYWAATSFVDNQVGRVLTELETLGLAQNTTVVVMSDHGYHLGDMGLWTKNNNFEPDNRVVLMIRDPSRAASSANSTVYTNVELLDLYPTLVDVAGYTVPSYLQGKSLTPLLDNPTATPAGWKNASYSQSLRTEGYMGYSVRTDSWRFTKWIEYNASSGQAFWDKNNGVELYDHRGDPRTAFGDYERANLGQSSQYAATRVQLDSLLRTQRATNATTQPPSQTTTQSSSLTRTGTQLRATNATTQPPSQTMTQSSSQTRTGTQGVESTTAAGIAHTTASAQSRTSSFPQAALLIAVLLPVAGIVLGH